MSGVGAIINKDEVPLFFRRVCNANRTDSRRINNNNNDASCKHGGEVGRPAITNANPSHTRGCINMLLTKSAPLYVVSTDAIFLLMLLFVGGTRTSRVMSA